jgi:hypothetical protein
MNDFTNTEEYQGIRVSGYQGIRVSGYQGIRVSGYQGIRVSGYQLAAAREVTRSQLTSKLPCVVNPYQTSFKELVIICQTLIC